MLTNDDAVILFILLFFYNNILFWQIEESKRLANALPKDIYNKVCDTLNIPVIHYLGDEDVGVKGKFIYS